MVKVRAATRENTTESKSTNRFVVSFRFCTAIVWGVEGFMDNFCGQCHDKYLVRTAL